MAMLLRASACFMITLADLTPRRDPVAYARARLDTQVMLSKRIWPYRAEIAFWSLWLFAVGAFIGLSAWVDHRYTLPLDRRITFGVQELYQYGWATRFFETVNRLGDQNTITLVLFSSFAVALLCGLRYEALMIAGTGAVRFLQLGVRHVVHRPDAEFLSLRSTFDGLQRPEFFPGPHGFPSGHVFGSAIVYGLIFAYAPRALTFKPLAIPCARFACSRSLLLVRRACTSARTGSAMSSAPCCSPASTCARLELDGVITHIRLVNSERALATKAGLRGDGEATVESQAVASGLLPEARTVPADVLTH